VIWFMIGNLDKLLFLCINLELKKVVTYRCTEISTGGHLPRPWRLQTTPPTSAAELGEWCASSALPHWLGGSEFSRRASNHARPHSVCVFSGCCAHEP